MQLFEAGKKKVYYFLFTLPKVAPLHPEFSLSTFFANKSDQTPPAPPLTRIQQKFAKIIRGLSKGANYKCHSFTSFVFTQKPALSSLFWGARGGCWAVPCSLCQLGNARGGVFRPFTFLGQGEQPAITKGLFSGPKKVRKIGNVTAGLLSSRFGAVDAGCMRIDFADMGLQRFSTSVHVKGPKTDPPGGTTFDSKRVHFWIPFEIDFLSPRV